MVKVCLILIKIDQLIIHVYMMKHSDEDSARVRLCVGWKLTADSRRRVDCHPTEPGHRRIFNKIRVWCGHSLWNL